MHVSGSAQNKLIGNIRHSSCITKRYSRIGMYPRLTKIQIVCVSLRINNVHACFRVSINQIHIVDFRGNRYIAETKQTFSFCNFNGSVVTLSFSIWVSELPLPSRAWRMTEKTGPNRVKFCSAALTLKLLN